MPKELWIGKPPSYKHLRVFGCNAYVHIRKDSCSKLDPKSYRCIFLGYGDNGEMGYRLWDPESHKIVRSNDVIFREDRMQKQPINTIGVRRVIFEEEGPPRQPQNANQNAVQNGQNQQPPGAFNAPYYPPQEEPQMQPEIQQDVLPQQAVQPQNMQEQQANQPPNQDGWVRRSTRVSRMPDRFVLGVNALDDYIMVTDCGEPSCFKEAMKREDAKNW